MELLQGAKDKAQDRYIKGFIADLNFAILPLTESVGHRALIYVEEYALSDNMRAGDAIIAATAVENRLILSSSNAKHSRCVKELELKVFRP